MLREDFNDMILDNLRDFIEDVEDIRIEQIKKPTSTYTGLLIKSKYSNVCPTINLDYLYDLYKDSSSIHVLIAISTIYEKAILNLSNNPISNYDFQNVESIKKDITLQILPLGVSEDYLNDNTVIYKDDNLGIIIRPTIPFDMGNGVGLMSIKSEHLVRLGVTKEELYEIAKENTTDYEFMSLNEKLGIPEEILPIDEQSLWILTNKSGNNGAALILNDNILENVVGKKFDSSFTILPSSIHEVLIVKDNSDMNSENLKQLIEDINHDQVSPEEQLLNYPLHFDMETKKLEKLEDYEKRIEQTKQQEKQNEVDMDLDEEKNISM